MSYTVLDSYIISSKPGTFRVDLSSNSGYEAFDLTLCDAAQINWRPNADVFPTVIASELEVVLRGDVMQRIRAAGDTGLRMRVFYTPVGGSEALFWIGYVVSDVSGRSLDKIGAKTKVRIGDGLHLLSNILYTDASGGAWLAESPDSYETPAQIICEILALTGHALPVNFAPRYWNHPDSEDVNPLTRVRINRGQLTQIDDAGSLIPSSAMFALNEVLRVFGLCVQMRFGAWWVIHRQQLFNEEYNIYRHAANGDFQYLQSVAISAGAGADITDGVVFSDQFRFREAGGTEEALPAIRSATVTLQHGTTLSFVRNGDFSRDTPTEFWTLTNTSTEVGYLSPLALTVEGEFSYTPPYAFTVNSNAQQGIGMLAGDDGLLWFSARVKQVLPRDQSPMGRQRWAFFALNVNAGTENYWLNDADEWVVSATPVWTRMEVFAPNIWQLVERRFSAPPETGAATLYLGGVVDTNYFSVQIDPEDPLSIPMTAMAWDEVQLIGEYGDGSEGWNATSMTITDTGASSTIDGETVNLLFGSGPYAMNPGTIQQLDGDPASDWKRGGYSGGTGSGDGLEMLLAEDNIRARRVDIARHRAAYFSPDQLILPSTMLRIGGRVFAASEISLDLRSGRSSGLFDEVSDAGFASMIATKRDIESRALVDDSNAIRFFIDRANQAIAALESPIARTDEYLEMGVSYTQIAIQPLTSPILKAGIKYTLINAATGRRHMIAVARNQRAGDAILHIDAFTPPENIYTDSPITATSKEVSAALSLVEFAFRVALTGAPVAILSDAYIGFSPGGNSAEISVEPISVPMIAGTKLRMIDNTSVQRTVYLAEAAEVGDDVLTISGGYPTPSVLPIAIYPVGTEVYAESQVTRTEFLQTAQGLYSLTETVSDVGDIVTTHSTQISQNTTDITLRATRSQLVDDINNVAQTSLKIAWDKLSINGPLETNNAIRSSNYVQGISGWELRANGEAELAQGVFRGSVLSATGTSPNVITALVGQGTLHVYHLNANQPSVFVRNSDITLKYPSSDRRVLLSYDKITIGPDDPNTFDVRLTGAGIEVGSGRVPVYTQGVGIPSNTSGRDGDMHGDTTGGGRVLWVKIAGQWVEISMA